MNEVGTAERLLTAGANVVVRFRFNFGGVAWALRGQLLR
jgi:hypothetical protein